MIPALEDLLSYDNEHVWTSFADKYGICDSDAQIIFRELLKWLWLSVRLEVDRTSGDITTPRALVMDDSLYYLDEMWHTFILFTRDYHQFCDRYFSEYLHHAPTPRHLRVAERRQFQEDRRLATTRYAEELRRVYLYVHQHLGPHTLELWVSVLPERFPKSKLERLTTATTDVMCGELC